jgi:hypothetical protein
MRTFMRAVCVTGASAARPWKNATCRVGVVPGVRKQRARWVHGPQSRFAPRK